MKKLNKNQRVDKVLQDFEQKYCDLIWYARINPKNHHIPGVLTNKLRVESMYPNDVEDLKGEHGDWHHGFNSGMLACARYLSTLKEYGSGLADKEFPMLDS